MQCSQCWCTINYLCLSRSLDKIFRSRENSNLKLINWCINTKRSTKDGKEIFIAERVKGKNWYSSKTGEIIDRSWLNKMLKSFSYAKDWIGSCISVRTV